MKRNKGNHQTDVTEYYNDPVRQYLQDIANYQPVAADEETVLAQRIAKGDLDARNQLVSSHLSLAVGLARQYTHRGVDLADLIQEANLGLIEAASHFNPSKGRFVTYQDWWVRSRLVRITSRQHQEVRLEEEEAQMIQDTDPTPEEMIYLQQLSSALHATFACLTERERLVLILRYGLDGKGENRTRVQTARKLRLNTDQVRRSEQSALEKIRQSGGGEALRDYWIERSA